MEQMNRDFQFEARREFTPNHPTLEKGGRGDLSTEQKPKSPCACVVGAYAPYNHGLPLAGAIPLFLRGKLMCHTLCLGLVLTSTPTTAVEFKQVQINESTVTFAYKQMGVPMEGKFAKFTAQATFDPAKLAKAQARIDIDLASIDTGSDEANDEVKAKLWFNTQAFPSAGFVSTGVKALGGNRYEATGKLTIKGKTLDVVAPFTFKSTATLGTFDGNFILKRLDYNIGEGIWTDVSAVADEIQIKFHLVVNASPAKK
jgi:polyisoprenoid-binding protein YceI